MLDNKIDINFLTLFSLITFFVFLLITKYGKKIRNGILLDTDYNKPQAFHIEAITRCGGLAAFISLIIFTVLNNLFFAVFYIEYMILGGCLFLIGFFWMLFHAGLLILMAKLIKAPFFFLAVGSQANVGGAASAPIVASAFHPSLAPVGVLLAVLGYALGTYGAWLCGVLLQITAL